MHRLYSRYSSSVIVPIFVMCLLSFAAQGEQIKNRNALGLWQAIEPFGIEQNLNRHQQGFYEFGQYFQLMDAWHQSMYAPLNENPLWNGFRRNIQEQDRDQFLSSPTPYFQNTRSKLSTLVFEGDWRSEKFDMYISKQPESEDISTRFGNLKGKVDFSPGTLKPENIISNLNISINLGSLLFTEMLESIEAMNREFRHDRIASLPTSPMHLVEGSHSKRSSLDQTMFALFMLSLPSSMNTLTAISSFEKFVAFDSTPSGKHATRVNIKQRIDLHALEDKFPDTSDDFEYLLNGLSFESEVRTADDRVLARFAYDAEQTLVSADLTVVDGGFGLKNHKGELLDDIIFPTQLKKLNYKIVSSAKVSLFGLKIDITNLSINAFYDAGLGAPRIDRKASIAMKMADMPSIETSGAFFYIFPSWLIDLFIPGTIETLIADSFEDLVTGNNGEGLTLNFTFAEENNQQTLALAASAELPFEVIQELLKLENNESDQLQSRLYRTLRNDLRRDFAGKAIQYSDPRLKKYVEALLSRKKKGDLEQ